MVRTRLAPSPTGKLHLGTARAALFNFLFARKNKGKFILRIEDTDRSRSTLEFEKDILESLEFLGLKYDEGPYRQTERLEIYQKYIEILKKKLFAEIREGALYFKVPKSGKITFSDEIHGELNFDLSKISDFVLQKSDGSPLFLLTNVVDDFEMKISHVIRGDDHLPNTPRQILIAKALGFPPPRYAHLPLILAPDRSKLSKRAGAKAISEYKDEGYLPEALINFMALLGWSSGDDRQFFTLPDLISQFDLKKIQKSPAVFDQKKLDFLNGHYIRQKNVAELTKIISEFLGEKVSEKLVSAVKDRLVKISDFKNLSSFFFQEPSYNSKLLIFKKSDKERTKKGLNLAHDRLASIGEKSWTSVKLTEILTGETKKNNLENGDVFWPVRVALSGQENSPPPEVILETLGKEKSLKRIKKAIEKL